MFSKAAITVDSDSVAIPPKRKRRRFQFGLRRLLTVTAVFAVVLAFVRIYILPYRAEVAMIDRIKNFNTGTAPGQFQVFTEPRGDYFLRLFFGDKLSQRVVYVHLFSDEVTDQWLSDNIAGLRHVEVLTITSPKVTDAGLEHLRSLTDLNELGLPNTQATDEGVEQLKRALPNLKRVWR